MTCEELTDFLGRYVDGEMAGAEKGVFEEHLGICPNCRVFLDSYRTTIAMGKDACTEHEGSAVAPEGLVRAILAAREAAKDGEGE